jgi:hypothetical protein
MRACGKFVAAIDDVRCKRETSGVYLCSELTYKEHILRVKCCGMKVGDIADLQFQVWEIQNDEDGGDGGEKQSIFLSRNSSVTFGT